METKIIGIEVIDLPDGFYIGDPCYILPDDLYKKIINDYHDGMHYDDNGRLIAFTSRTSHGDGEYPVRINTENYHIPIDSGIIALVNLKFASKKKLKDYNGATFRDWIAKVDFYCYGGQFYAIYEK